MPETKYKVVDIHGNVIAEAMELEDACVLLQALCEKYYEEAKCGFAVRAYEKTLEENNDCNLKKARD